MGGAGTAAGMLESLDRNRDAGDTDGDTYWIQTLRIKDVQ